MAQDRGDIGVGAVDQTVQEMLYLNVVMAARQSHAGRGFKRTAAGIIQPPDQRFQINCGHGHLPTISFVPWRVRLDLGMLDWKRKGQDKVNI